MNTAWANRGGQLVVADPAAEKLYVYRLPGLELVAEFSEIRMATHPGFLPFKCSGGHQHTCMFDVLTEHVHT